MVLALVDETGDPGTGGKGRPWFCWVAVVVPDDQLSAMRDARNLLRDECNWVHAKPAGDDLTGVLRLVNAAFDWQWVAVVSDTRSATRETAPYIHLPTQHRFYSMLILLERLSWLGEARKEQVTVMVERPNDKDFGQAELRLRHERGLPHSWAKRDYLRPDNIHLEAPKKLRLLGFAHAVAHAVGKAMNPHPMWSKVMPETIYPEYLQIIWDRVWVGPCSWDPPRNLTDRGFTLLPVAKRRQFRAQIPFLDEWLGRLHATS